MIQHVVAGALKARLSPVVVVLGHAAHGIRQALPETRELRVVINRDYESGQASSLRAGIQSLDAHIQGAMVFLADQPGVDPGVVRRVLATFREGHGPVVRPRYGDQPGHPVLLGRETWPELLALTGDAGARHLLEANLHWVTEVKVEAAPPLEVDTPADYAQLLGSSPHAGNDPAHGNQDPPGPGGGG